MRTGFFADFVNFIWVKAITLKFILNAAKIDNTRLWPSHTFCFVGPESTFCIKTTGISWIFSFYFQTCNKNVIKGSFRARENETSVHIVCALRLRDRTNRRSRRREPSRLYWKGVCPRQDFQRKLERIRRIFGYSICKTSGGRIEVESKFAAPRSTFEIKIFRWEWNLRKFFLLAYRTQCSWQKNGTECSTRPKKKCTACRRTIWFLIQLCRGWKTVSTFTCTGQRWVFFKNLFAISIRKIWWSVYEKLVKSQHYRRCWQKFCCFSFEWPNNFFFRNGSFYESSKNNLRRGFPLIDHLLHGKIVLLISRVPCWILNYFLMHARWSTQSSLGGWIMRK